MNISAALYLVPYLGSLGLSLGVLLFASVRRGAPGTPAYLWYSGGQTLYILGFIMGMISPSLGTKIFWESFQYIAGLLIVIAFPVFAVKYTDHKLHNPKLLFRLSLIVPIIFAILLVTDGLHHQFYSDPHLQSAYIFQKLDYGNTFFIVTYAIYGYLILSFGIYLLFQRLIHPHELYRSQIITIIIGILVPILGTVLVLTDVLPAPQHDPTAFTTAIGNLVIAWGLYRFRLFKVTPIGRDKVFEAMVEPVVILDNNNLIVDANGSMLALLGKKSENVIGEFAKNIFADFPIPIKQYMQVSYARAESTFVIGGVHVYYELTVWPLYNERKEMTGRIYISHDITAQKELERELRKLNSELEDRVRARTSELAEAYDTTLEGWARALELRDKETEGHSRRVMDMTVKIARSMKIPEEDINHIRRGAILHDIGKMSVPDEILHKRGKLTEKERSIINEHPDTAYKLLSPIPFLKKALDIPLSHHEKWDGTGYPQGLKGEDIPLAARIFAIADVWDALGSDRPYNQAWPREKIIAYFAEQSGKHFDPIIINVFFGLIEKGEI